MDPVNKWLTVVILFMASALFVFWKVGSVSRYEMQVLSTGADSAVIYVLDTKEGDVHAQIVDEKKLYRHDSTPYNRPQEVFELPSSFSTHRRY